MRGFIDTWTADYPYPSDVLENLVRSNGQFNNVAISDPQVDAALAQAKGALTFDGAIKAYQQAESIALNENRLIPLYSGIEPYLVLKDIWGLPDREVERIALWMADALVDAALREARTHGSRKPAADVRSSSARRGPRTRAAGGSTD